MVESWSLRQNRLLHSLYWGCLLLLCYIQMVKSVEKAPFAEVDVSGLQHNSFSSPDAIMYKSLFTRGDTLYIGGKEKLIFRNAVNISNEKQSPIPWEATASDKVSCRDISQGSPDICFNFIRFVQPYNETHLLLCGTMALNPKNTFLNIRKSKKEEDTIIGTALCSPSPSDNITSQRVSEGGVLSMFAATSKKYLVSDMALVKNLPSAQSIRTDGSDFISGSSNFVSSFAANDNMMGYTMKKVYFVFTEYDRKNGFVTNIAQVCANDEGGTWKQNVWTSFLRTKLVCQLDGGSKSFTFDEATGITFTSDGIIYGTFTSRTLPSGYKPGMCAYPGMNGNPNATSRNFDVQFHEYMLQHTTVKQQAISSVLDARDTPGALLQNQREIFVKIKVHRVNSTAGNPYDVMYIATASGKVIKATRNAGTDSASKVRQLAVYQVSSERIADLVLSSNLGQMYVDTNAEVVQLPLANCEAYHSSCTFCDVCRMCILARDPMCGWNKSLKRCVDTSKAVDPAGFLQNVTNVNTRGCGDLVLKHSRKEADVGDGVILGVHTDSKSVSTKWYKNTTKARIPLKQPAGPGANYHLNADGRLEFYSLTPNDFGDYVCDHFVENVLVASRLISLQQPSSLVTVNTHKSTVKDQTPGSADQTSGYPGDSQKPTNKSVNGHPNATAAPPVVPTQQPTAGSSTTITVIVVIVVIVLVLLVGAVLLWRKRHDCWGEARMKTTDQKPSNSRMDLTMEPTKVQPNETNNSNNKILRYSEAKSDTPLLSSSPKDLTDSVPDPQSSNNCSRKVATVTPMPVPTESIAFIDDSENPAASAPSHAERLRKPPLRSKSIPSRNVVVSLGDDLKFKCNSIKRHPKRGTLVVEVSLPSNIDIEEDGGPNLTPLDLSSFNASGDANETDAFLLTGSGGGPSNDLNRASSDPAFGKLATDTDSDSTLKADNAGSLASSATSTPRARDVLPVNVAQPLLSSSYNTRLRNATPSPRSSPMNHDASAARPNRPGEKAANLRAVPTRTEKSPTSTTSSSSTSSSNNYHTPPHSPNKVS